MVRKKSGPNRDATAAAADMPSVMPTLPLIAYRLNPVSMPLVTGPTNRDWMDATPNRFAYRCLPMLIANQAGWLVLTGHTIAATWNGAPGIDALRIECLKGEPPHAALSIFGIGILTWTLPYLFRTPPGYNLLVRGPANWPKDGIAPLEGVVETDWADSTFTMNWKLTRPNHTVTFETGEPIAQIVPQPRGELEFFRPEIRPVSDNPELADAYRQWAASRRQFNYDLNVADSTARKQGWQKHYAQGRSITEARPPEHQSKLALRGFVEKS